ncbi:hypothetical protein [Pseudomonas sp. W2-17]|uniref:hypothetical protein n=1 Tax=Pseudomonas sp. W2-17 TaxID=3058039 RepID=UPI0034E095E8
MNLIKSLVLTVAALSSTSLFAQDGSERSNHAAQKMRIAQEVRFNDKKAATEYVRVEEKSRADDVKKSEG